MYMSNMRNLLVMALEDIKQFGKNTINISDSSLEFLKHSINIIANDSHRINPEKCTLKTSNKKNLRKALFPENPKVVLPVGDKLLKFNWLKDKVLNCPVCNQHIKPGKKIVFGTGNLDADIFFCGEAPGADEEIQGVPFVGRAGKLLTKIILAMGLTREQVYIGNIMNWRPELDTPFGNRPPTQEEMNFCLPYLKAQIEIVQPKVIVALGATAVNGLFGYDSSRKMKDVRGHWLNFEDVPCMVTFHPSYLLRNNSLSTKRIIWEDMLEVMKKVGLNISNKQQNYFL